MPRVNFFKPTDGKFQTVGSMPVELDSSSTVVIQGLGVPGQESLLEVPVNGEFRLRFVRVNIAEESEVTLETFRIRYGAIIPPTSLRFLDQGVPAGVFRYELRISVDNDVAEMKWCRFRAMITD